MAVPTLAQDERLGYQPALDGVRAIAICGVLAFHAGMPAPAVGYLGVDLFFVLSGFLITTLLLEERARVGTISLRRFYARRALRLAPALYVMLAIVTLGALVALSGDGRTEVLQEVAAAGTYLYDLSHPLGLHDHYLGHTWSLAVEEQFYVVWPPLLMLLLARNARRVATVGTIAVVILALGLRYLDLLGPGKIFLYRPEGPLIGCALALVLFGRRRVLAVRCPKQIAAVGVAAIAAVTFLMTRPGDIGPDSMHGVGFALFDLAAVALLLSLAVLPTSLLGRLLSIRPLVAIGRVSYGLYLWHLPVFRVADVLPPLPRPMMWIVQLAGSAVVCVLSYRFVELPFLRRKARFSASPDPVGGTPAPATSR